MKKAYEAGNRARFVSILSVFFYHVLFLFPLTFVKYK